MSAVRRLKYLETPRGIASAGRARTTKGDTVKFLKAEVIFEAFIDLPKYGSYLTIYGKHEHGYFCCLPAWGLGCEMSNADDVFYNADKLQEKCGLNPEVARGLARGIRRAAEAVTA